MQEYYLPDYVHLCQFDDGGVLLDLRREKYFGVDSLAMQALQPFIQGCDSLRSTVCNGIEPEDAPSALADLERSHLLTKDSTLGRPFRPLPFTCTDAVPFEGRVADEAEIRPRHVLNFLRAGITAAAGLRICSLERIVARVRIRKARHAPQLHAHDIAVIVDLVKILRRLAPLLFTTKEFCLRDSLMLVEFLAQYGVFPTWVIGVRTRPFGAHSWVQHEALLLNDTLQHVETFTPILTV